MLTAEEFTILQSFLARCPFTPGEVPTANAIIAKLQPQPVKAAAPVADTATAP